MKIITIQISVAALAVLALAGCGEAGRAAAAPTVTQTVIKWKTRTMTEPGPTVTKTVYRPVPAQQGGGSSGSAAGGNQVIVRLNGSGTQNTPTFTTPSRWHLSWSYWGCPGGTSNFAVDEYNADGSPDPSGVSVNELGTGRGPVATYAYGDAGTHYLSVNTEGCSWSLVPVTGLAGESCAPARSSANARDYRGRVGAMTTAAQWA